MAVWLLASVAAQRLYTFTPPGQTSATTWAAPAAYPEYVQTPYAPQYVPSAQYEQAEGWSMPLLLIGAGAAGAAAGVAMKRPVAALTVSADDSKQAVAIGAACVGGIVGVFFFHELSTAVILALIFAYGTTFSNGFGNATRTAGETYNKVYDKTVALNDEYEILDKAKSAADFTVAAASDFDESFQISSRVDEKLKLSQAVDKVKSKVDEVTEQIPQKISQKVQDLKTKSIEVD
jgi:hypothetical protein